MTFSNPLLPASREGADPFLTWHDGEYFLSVTRGDHISFYRAPTLAGLHSAPEQIVWQDAHPQRHTAMWAPEFFHIDGRWWCYYCAADGKGRHRALVLRGHERDLGGPWEFAAQLMTDASDEHFAIDFSVIQAGSGLYGIWAAHPDHRLYIARMDSPTRLSGERVLLEADGFGCEEVREGPFCRRRNGRIFLVYSVCDARKADYKLGMLVADDLADLTDPASWRQHPEPVFTRDDEARVFGPGHHSFFRSPDGSEDWVCYHAKLSTEFTYDDRVPCAKRIGWNADGTPNLGTPPAFGQELDEPSGTPS